MLPTSPATPEFGSLRLDRRCAPSVHRAGPASPTAARLAAATVFCRLSGPAAPGSASEVVTLADNTQVAGKLTHYYDGVIVLETSNGQKIELPRDKVKAITFKLPPARA